MNDSTVVANLQQHNSIAPALPPSSILFNASLQSTSTILFERSGSEEVFTGVSRSLLGNAASTCKHLPVTTRWMFRGSPNWQPTSCSNQAIPFARLPNTLSQTFLQTCWSGWERDWTTVDHSFSEGSINLILGIMRCSTKIACSSFYLWTVMFSLALLYVLQQLTIFIAFAARNCQTGRDIRVSAREFTGQTSSHRKGKGASREMFVPIINLQSLETYFVQALC